MAAYGTGKFLHRLDAGDHGLVTPGIKEFGRPCRGVVLPHLLEGFLEQIGSNRLQVVLQQVAQTKFLTTSEILFALEQAPTGFLQNRLIAILFHAARFVGADLVEGIIHLGDDMKAVEDIEGLRTVLADEAQIRLTCPSKQTRFWRSVQSRES